MERIDHQKGAVRGSAWPGPNLSDANLIINPGGKRQALTNPERNKLLVEWNQTRTEYLRDACVHHLFEAQVERSPEAVAVECQGYQLTYQELNIRANRLAHHLQSLGVGPETLVGICVEPSLDMIVGLLGILKAGGAYVPLDPGYPTERLAFMVNDTAMKVLLTQKKLRPTLPSGGARVVCLDATLPGSCDSAGKNPASKASAESLVYVIYTSGSTGIPKGVMIPHRGLVNYLVWAADAYHVIEGKGSPVHSSISFDLTITGLFVPLLVGRCVYVVPPTQRAEGLVTELRRNENFSLVKITPAHLELLGSQLSRQNAAGRAHSLIIGGDALFGKDLAFWQAHAPETVLVNEYGPTETVVGCCVYFVPRGKRLDGPVPIGRPIANTQLYVLAPDLEPVPIGAKGELYIGGDGVARGYLNLPELTAASFIPNPFANGDPTASPKLYKTGDLVRYQPDGNLEFLGRVDHQVKVRGYRIEPSEIESALAAHPQVQGAAVVARESRTGDKCLTAYIVWRGQPAPALPEFRQFLKEKLPDYMVPAEFVTLVSFPLTPNGKVDRKALRPPGLESVVSCEYVAPQTEIERRIAEVWQEMLQRPRIGLHESFFDLGGHSLLAVRLIAEINRIFINANLTVLSLFECPTIAMLARTLQDGKQVLPSPRLIQLKSEESGPPIFFVSPFLDVYGLTKVVRLRQPFFLSETTFGPEIVPVSAERDDAALPSVEEMAAPHTTLIRDSGFSGPCILAGGCFGSVLAFEVAHQLQHRGISVEALFIFDSVMKIPAWERLKRRSRRHLHNTLQHGLGYLWHQTRQRLRRELKTHAARVTRRSAPQTLALTEMPLEDTDLIEQQALRRYRLAPLPCRGVLFQAQEHIENFDQDQDENCGWGGLFEGGLEVVRIPGNHFSMWKEPHVLALSRFWEARLEELLKKSQNLKGTHLTSLVGGFLGAALTSWKCLLISEPNLLLLLPFI